MMNCGYDPHPSGKYDLPPIAPQMWHAYHIAGEQLSFALVAALLYRFRTGKGQLVSCAVHEAVSKSTEVDLMTWVMRRALVLRQTCRHAREDVSPQPVDRAHQGRPLGDGEPGQPRGRRRAARCSSSSSYGIGAGFNVDEHGGAEGRTLRSRHRPGDRRSRDASAWRPCSASCARSPTRTCRGARRRKRECSGRRCASRTRTPIDEHWLKRGSVTDIEHPELGRSFRYSDEQVDLDGEPWSVGRRAPLLNEDAEAIVPQPKRETAGDRRRTRSVDPNEPPSTRGKPFPLHGIRILDFTWFLASAGGTRFLAAFGAESIKVELKTPSGHAARRDGAGRRPRGARQGDGAAARA